MKLREDSKAEFFRVLGLEEEVRYMVDAPA